MDDTNKKMSRAHGKMVVNPFALKKPKKRSLVERELETNMTALMTSPASVSDGMNTSRYGRARRMKYEKDVNNISMESLKSPTSENTPVKKSAGIKSGGNSIYKAETSKKALENSLDNHDNIRQENTAVSPFSPMNNSKSAEKNTKVYIRKDLIQNRDDDDHILLIKDLFSPKSATKVKSSPRSNVKRSKPLVLPTEKLQLSFKKQNGHIDNTSVVKTLDFDSNKNDLNTKKRDSHGNKRGIANIKTDSLVNKSDSDSKKINSASNKTAIDSNKKYSDGNKRGLTNVKTDSLINKNDSDSNNTAAIDSNKKGSDGNKSDSSRNKKKKDALDQRPANSRMFDVEAACPYQVGDLVWARMGTFPFWPCIVTKDPASSMFARKKLFGRVEHYIIHVTFFADNGRRSWVVDNMLRHYKGLDEFISTRDKFTTEEKKKDPRLYAAFFISEKKQSLWNTSVEEAEMINREPKRTRIDVLNDVIYKARESKKQKGCKITRTGSDVSLSESLYDSLFSEDDSKDDTIRTRNRSNRSLDVSDIVTACLDNMAAKTGNIKIQRQSHMDRWLQKAKSKTPEKVKTKIELTPIKVPIVIPKTEPIDLDPTVEAITPKIENITTKVDKPAKNNKKRKLPPKELKITKVYGLRRSYESQQSFLQQSKQEDELKNKSNDKIVAENATNDKNNEIKEDNNDDVLNAINELLDDKSAIINNVCKENKELPAEGTGSEIPSTVEFHEIHLEIKPEVMDVDEVQQSDDNTEKEVSSPSKNVVILESPIKIEKEPCTADLVDGNSSLEKEIFSANTLNGRSPVKIESPVEKYAQITSNAEAIKIKTMQKAIEIPDKPSKISSKQTSPLKNNEMVLIPDNINLADDECNSMTSFDDNGTVVSNNGHSNFMSEIEMRENNEVDLIHESINDNVISAINRSEEKQPSSEPDLSIASDVKKANTQVEAIETNENNMSIDEIPEEDITMTEKDLLNESGHSESILQIDDEITGLDKNPVAVDELSSNRSKTINETTYYCNKSTENKVDNENPLNNSNTTNPFLDDSRNIDCVDSALVNKDHFFRDEDMNKPPDLTLSQKNNELDPNNSDSAEDSDDEPSPEFEPLEEEIKEDFRQHMMCIKSNITDRKDEAQLVKVCNEMAVLEESKIKLNDIKLNISKVSLEKSLEINESNATLNDEQIFSELSLESEKDYSKELKSEVLDNIDITNLVENSLKSPSSKKRYKLSLKKDTMKISETITNPINPMYKTIEQIEEIIKSKPKRLPLENEEICIPGIAENGLKREIDTPENEDDDFNIDNASVSSEDSEVSLPQNRVPARRSLRSKPEKKVGLEDPDFLNYMELRQDDLMEEHPDLTSDDIVLYLYKTYTYSKNLTSEIKLEDSPLKVKQETPTPPRPRSHKKQVQPKNTIENYFREKFNRSKRIDIESSENAATSSKEDFIPKKETLSVSPVDSGIGNSKDGNEVSTPVSSRRRNKVTPKDVTQVTKEIKKELINETNETVSPTTPKRLRRKTISPRVLQRDNKLLDKRVPVVVISPIKTNVEIKPETEMQEPKQNDVNTPVNKNKRVENLKTVIETKQEDTETESMDSESEVPLRQLRSKFLQEKQLNELKNKEISEIKDEDVASVSSDNEPLVKTKKDKNLEGSYEDPEFLKYMELKQDALMDENPHLTHNEIKAYLYKTWIYEKDSKSDMQKNDDIESSNLVKGTEPIAPQRKAKRRPKREKSVDLDVKESEEIVPKEKPKRKTASHYYNEELLSDDEEVCEEVFTTKNTLEDVEYYFKELVVTPKPSFFKGLVREKVCGICEDVSNLIKCKGCNGTFHYDCVNRVVEVTDSEKPCARRGRKKKRKTLNGRKSNENNDERQDVSEENISIEDTENLTVDAATLESQLEAKMKELIEKEAEINYDSYTSDEGTDWADTVPGKCELIDVKLKRRTPPIDVANFKCNNCRIHDRPICFVCNSAVSKTGVKTRQKCSAAHCHSYYHMECLNHWPQTQFNAGEWSKSKADQQALTCPRHVCHTCVSDDPRGCRTRFCGDKLAKCVRCPATYHSFNKCLPAGTKILTASFIVCPRHYEHRPGKVACHVNTGWCFICAQGGSLICCEYCPTSFHAECLNIKPPEGNYMCEDCETGRLPLYGEIMWVKLGHYRWWPAVILHPSEIPEGIKAGKRGIGEFVVRFFGQYDHYWVNRGRVFPYQEGDSGKVSSNKSKIDAAFTNAMEHAQMAYEVLKNAEANEEETQEINSSLLPPHYVKLKSNKPTGSLLGRKIEDPSLSLTQCECNPADPEPCGPNSQCLNRVLLTECGPTCRAGERCNNRAFEKRQYPRLAPYRAPHRGWGLKTLDDIKAGQFVIEYVGELIDIAEFRGRMRRKHEIRDENFYFLILDKERMIDAEPKGNLARFMNHCCEPNCETQKWTVLGDVRVGLFAIDDIKANSEVTFNYNYLECTGMEKKRCMCGAKRCSGYIGAKPKQLDESQKKKNGIIAKRKYTKRKETEDSPSTSKNKTKRPLGRPRKEKPPKELTEIEKDLLIIKSATPNSDESRPPSVDDKRDSNTTIQDAISNTVSIESNKEETNAMEVQKVNCTISEDKVLKTKLDPNTTEDVRILNGIEPKLQKIMDSTPLVESIESKAVKRKASDTVDSVTMKSEPRAKRLKCEKRIEVGD